MAAIEEGQQVGHTGSKPGFKDTHQEPQGHHALPILDGSLARCDQAPAMQRVSMIYTKFFTLPEDLRVEDVHTRRIQQRQPIGAA